MTIQVAVKCSNLVLLGEADLKCNNMAMQQGQAYSGQVSQYLALAALRHSLQAPPNTACNSASTAGSAVGGKTDLIFALEDMPRGLT